MMIPYGYKQTEVGVIPEDWDVRKIGDFTDITAGGTPSTSHPEYWNGEILWMNSGELNNRRIHNVIGRITELGYNNSSTHMIPKNCVLIGLAGQGKTRGTVAVNYVELCTNQSIAAIFPSKEHNSEYLYQNLRSRYAELRELSSGDGGRGGLNLTIIKNFPCAFPKLQEQNRIAEALSDVDGMISSLEKLIAKYKSIKAACLQQMFPQNGETVPRMRLPGFTDDWEQCELGELALFNPKDELPQTFEYVDLESVVGTEMLSHRTEAKSSAPSRAQRLAHTGDLFYQTVRPYQRNNYLFEKPDNNYVFSTGYAQMRPYVDGYFLLSLVQSDRFVKVVLDNCTGTSYPAINANDLAEIEVTAPLDENEAQKIGTIFRSIDHLITLYQRKLEKVQKIKQGMMQQLLTGKIRLV